LTVCKQAGLPLARFNQVLTGLSDLSNRIKETPGVDFNIKSGVTGGGLSQFAFKMEAAGKVRVFALLDTMTQSILKPLHDALFDLLRSLPNDGTFDQDASVKRSAEKLQKYGIAYSFDLSAATDRLPAKLTASILEKIFKIEGLGEA